MRLKPGGSIWYKINLLLLFFNYIAIVYQFKINVLLFLYNFEIFLYFILCLKKINIININLIMIMKIITIFIKYNIYYIK